VNIESDGGLQKGPLTYPEKHNFIDDQMRATSPPSVTTPAATALVPAGRGTAFCGGADLPAIFGDRYRWSFALLLIRQAASASVLSRASVIFAGSRA